MDDNYFLFLQSIGEEIVGEFQEACPVAFSDLKTSIDFKIVNDQILFTMNDYWKYVEFGTAPHWAPIEPLKRWSKKVLKDEGAAYAVRWKIHKEGTDPQPFLRYVLYHKANLIIDKKATEFGISASYNFEIGGPS